MTDVAQVGGECQVIPRVGDRASADRAGDLDIILPGVEPQVRPDRVDRAIEVRMTEGREFGVEAELPLLQHLESDGWRSRGGRDRRGLRSRGGGLRVGGFVLPQVEAPGLHPARGDTAVLRHVLGVEVHRGRRLAGRALVDLDGRRGQGVGVAHVLHLDGGLGLSLREDRGACDQGRQQQHAANEGVTGLGDVLRHDRVLRETGMSG